MLGQNCSQQDAYHASLLQSGFKDRTEEALRSALYFLQGRSLTTSEAAGYDRLVGKVQAELHTGRERMVAAQVETSQVASLKSTMKAGLTKLLRDIDRL